MRRTALVILVLALLLPATAAAHDRQPRWKPVPTGSDQQYRGLDAVDKRVAWVGGSDGEVLRTTDGGRTWKDVSPPDTTGLLFRDVEAQDDAARERAGDRRGRRLADLHHDRRRPPLEARLRQRRPDGLLRLHGLLRRRPARPRAQRPGRRQVPDRRDRRRRPQLARAPERRHAGRRGGRVRLRRQRHVPGHQRPRRLVRERRRRRARVPVARRRLHVEGHRRADPGHPGRRRVLARVPQPARGRDGGRRLRWRPTTASTRRASPATAAGPGSAAATSPATARASTGCPASARR